MAPDHSAGRDVPLVLASASPRRRDLLVRVGIPLEVRPADVDEMVRAGESPLDCAARLAADKARAIARAVPGALVLGADTVVELGGEALGKPAGAAEARAMLAALAGTSHAVTTALSLVGPRATQTEVVTSDVRMRRIGEAELEDYVAAGEWRDKAGAYAIQGMAAAFVTEVRGSVTNVVGLPLAETLALLARAGGPGPRYQQGVPA